MKQKPSQRFNFLLTSDQKMWLSQKSSNLKSCGSVIRELIDKAILEDNEQQTKDASSNR